MDSKKAKIISIVSVIALAAILVGATYAYFQAQTGEGSQTDIKINANTVDTFNFETGDPLSINLNQENFASGKGNQTGSTYAKAILTANNKTNSATNKYYLYLNISNNTFGYTQDENTPEIILTIKDGSNTELTSVTGLTHKTVTDGKGNTISGFDITDKNGLITIFSNRSITTTSTTEETWNVTVTFVNYNLDQSANAGKRFNAKLMIQKEEYKQTIKDYVILQYTGTQGDNNIYYHNGTLENGINDNSYRYAGASESVNNFVCFGSDATTCPTDNLYRIVGVIDGKVKLIKYDYATSALLGKEGDYGGTIIPSASYYKGSQSSIHIYYWNNATLNNVWSDSELNITNLNTNFIMNIESAWTNKIAMTTWKVGKKSLANMVLTLPSEAYHNEIASPAENTTYDAAIGLMYVSDYYYAASPSAWTLVGYNSSDSTKDYRAAVNNNWMYMGYHEWTITPISDNSSNALSVSQTGCVGDNYVAVYIGVRPVFNLESSVSYVSGSGTQSDPIRIN